MDFFRWLHPVHFDARPGKNRFTSVVFKNSSDDGLSAVESVCVENKSASIELHARTFYPTKVGPKVIFWRFDIKILPLGAKANQELSGTNDDCHYNIVGVSDKCLRSIFIPRPLSDFSIVDAGTTRPLELADMK